MPRVSKKGKNGRPATIAVGSRVKVRAVRGPDARGRWYWRALAYDPTTRKRPTVWSGWASAEGAERQVLQLVSSTPEVLPVERPEAESVRTVLDLMESWVARQEQRRDIAPNTARVYRTCARHIVGAPVARARVRRLCRRDLEDYRDTRLAAGAAPRTVRQEVSVLRTAWRWFYDLAGLQPPRLPTVRFPKRTSYSRVTPTQGEVLAMLEHMDGWARLAVVLLYATGGRPGEVRDLTWARVDLDRMTAILDGKTGPRAVPLSADAVAMLRQVRPASAAPGDRVLWCTPSTFDSFLGPRAMRAACEAAGVRRFTPYGLRRAAVDAMARAGVDIGTAAAITGHSPQVMLQHYRTVSEEDMRRGVEKAQLGVIPGGAVVPFPRAAEAV
jgi:integrase